MSFTCLLCARVNNSACQRGQLPRETLLFWGNNLSVLASLVLPHHSAPSCPHPLSPVYIWGDDSLGLCEILCAAVTCSPFDVSLLAVGSVALRLSSLPFSPMLRSPSRVTLRPIQETNHPRWFTGFHQQLQQKTVWLLHEPTNPCGCAWHHAHLYIHTLALAHIHAQSDTSWGSQCPWLIFFNILNKRVTWSSSLWASIQF